MYARQRAPEHEACGEPEALEPRHRAQVRGVDALAAAGLLARHDLDGAYYLGPDKGGEKAYRLLNEAMKKTGRAALAKWAARGKQYLVMIRPAGNGLVMQQLLYKDEVRPISEVPIEDAEVKEPELKLAVQLVEQIATDEFRPENYEDEVRKRYHEAIQKKVEGQEITAAPEAPRAQIVDLMEALKASLAAKAAAPPKSAAPTKKGAEHAQRATGTEG